MSLATRCTHCGTIFKVVQDQLKVSEGWVRCGRCHEVFNALPALFDLNSEPPPPRPQPPASPPPSPMAQTPAWSSTRPTELAPPTPIDAHTPLSAAELAAPPQPVRAATEFELDTAVGLPAPEHWSTSTSTSTPRPAPGVTATDVPQTDDSDALDSRYLGPSRDEVRQVKRPPGPEFADAQFPNDALQDAEDDWTIDSLPAAQPLPPEAPMPTVGALRSPSPPPASPTLLASAASRLQAAPAASEPQPDHNDDNPGIPTTLPSRFGEDFVPEQVQVQPPPSRRTGRSGTRGRDPATHTPDFVKRAQRQAFWRHPATRSALVTLLLGLTLGLGLQLAHQFRDLIAAYHPEARPLLRAWCEQAGCQLAPPLGLDALQVDSATLLRTASEGPDRYRLTVSVNNRSDIHVAWPHIDLSLTDERGTVIARRAFLFSDALRVGLGATGATGRPDLAPVPLAVPPKQSTMLQWSLRLDQLTPAGYSAELFYP
jgi:predicted Zn finger-like uncharacterized protein